jgi:hypothetical protein
MAFDADPAQVAAQGCKGYQNQETPVPPSVKQITCNNDKYILQFYFFKHEPVEQKHRRQENEKLNRIKQHKKQFWIAKLQLKIIPTK